MSAFSRTELVHCALVHLSTVGRHAATSLTTGYRGATEPDHRSLGKVGKTESMPKILTARRREDERERARLYLKSRLMLPTIPLGMVTLLAGYADVVLMWIQDQLTPRALLGSTILFLCGAVWGWGHARYERYLLGTCPEYFARKQKLLNAAKEYKRVKRDVPATGPLHPGRRFALAMYVVGIASQAGISLYYLGHMGVYAAIFLPWAGYFNAKVIFWRSLFTSG